MQQERRPLAGYALPIREPTKQPSVLMLASKWPRPKEQAGTATPQVNPSGNIDRQQRKRPLRQER